ncbi:glycosyltransferase [Acidipila sp. EB88]|uniref:glycosyltransferase n=1 Tax=Acidipila sp. EB88 TaxID=2305226 RepID=UPI000F5DC639|nr:glycosyltransferase [Acidipila sp. EB88]RRA48459.1 glycosyltransferase [Acidipila sp. EB88]
MRIVFATFGTFGDVNPLIGLGRALMERGHRVVLAAPSMFRRQAEAGGLAFAAIRPEQQADDAAMIAMIYDRKRGTERGLREFLFPALRESYEDLLAVVAADGGADLLVCGELAYAAPLVAEKTGVPWASYVLAPFSFFSGYDPPVLPPYPVLSRVLATFPLAKHLTGHLLRPFARAVTRSWCAPVYALRKELGLGRGESPLFDAKHAPGLVLALFSPLLGAPQRDWPAQTVQSGFAFYDRNAAAAEDGGQARLPEKLERFLEAGEPPVVFTLGSAAVMDPGVFWEQSAEAARVLGTRAVMLWGTHAEVPEGRPGDDRICYADYAPYSLLFPRAAAIVHQGGVGTTAQALRAGKPMLVMPYSHDQPDNALRMQRLGVARVLPREQYEAGAAARALRRLLGDPGYATRAREAAAVIAREDGIGGACDALERVGRG